mgnify:FL=1
MRKGLFTTLGITALVVLTSCSSTIEDKLPIGAADKEDDAVIAKYNLSDTIKEGYKLSGSFTAEKNAEIKSEYVLAISNDDPRTSDTYSETTLAGFGKIDLEATKKGDSYGELKFEAEIDVNKVFPKDAEEKVIYFVFHSSTWDRGDIMKYQVSDYAYSWDGDTVKVRVA